MSKALILDVVVISLLFLWGSTYGDKLLQPGDRIIGGKPSRIKDFPFMVSLSRESSITHFCGGTIVDSEWILTAGHCLLKKMPEDVFVTAGVSVIFAKIDKELKRQVRRSMRFFFFPGNDVNDVALIQLISPFQYNRYVSPVRLSENDYFGSCKIVGWGQLNVTRDENKFIFRGMNLNLTVNTDPTKNNSHRRKPSPLLHEADVSVINNEECKNRYRNHSKELADFIMPNIMVCAGAEGKDTCYGDSGGPLLCGGKQVGITSWGIGCAVKDIPTVYMNTYSYKDWIYETIRLQQLNGAPTSFGCIDIIICVFVVFVFII